MKKKKEKAATCMHRKKDLPYIYSQGLKLTNSKKKQQNNQCVWGVWEKRHHNEQYNDAKTHYQKLQIESKK